MKFVLFSEGFQLELCPKIFMEDRAYPNNTRLADRSKPWICRRVYKKHSNKGFL